MKILSTTMIFPGQATPGQGVFIKERLRGLPKDIDVEVLRLRPHFPGLGLLRTSANLRPPRFEIVDGIPVHDRRFFYLPGLFKSLDGDLMVKALDHFIQRSERPIDLIDAHFAYPTGYAAVQVGKVRQIPVTVTLRGTLASYAQDSRRAKLRDALLGADRIMAVSSSLAQLAEEIAGRSLDIRVIGNGVDTERFHFGSQSEARRALRLSATAPVLLTVGGLVKRKGVHRVLKVLPALLKEQPELQYLVAGGAGVEGDFSAEIKAMIAELGLEKQVQLLGAIDHSELVKYYRAADLFVLSTANEGWANVLQEALASGLPVVATDVGGNREVVGISDYGSIVPFDDSDALKAAIAEGLLKSYDRVAIAAYGGRRDWSDVGRETAEVFRELQ